MNRKTRSTVLIILFFVLCFAVVVGGLMAVRYTQGTAEDGDGLLIGLLAFVALTDLTMIRILS